MSVASWAKQPWPWTFLPRCLNSFCPNLSYSCLDSEVLKIVRVHALFDVILNEIVLTSSVLIRGCHCTINSYASPSSGISVPLDVLVYLLLGPDASHNEMLDVSPGKIWISLERQRQRATHHGAAGGGPGELVRALTAELKRDQTLSQDFELVIFQWSYTESKAEYVFQRPREVPRDLQLF